MNPQDDLDKLTDVAVKKAEDLLKKFTEFFPFAVVINNDGEVAFHLIGDDPEGTAAENAGLLRIAITEAARSAKLRGAAVVLNVTVKSSSQTNKQQAIALDIEHICGRSSTVYFPYTLSDGVVRFDAPFAESKAAEIFPRSKLN